jgi:hypothetical protein
MKFEDNITIFVQIMEIKALKHKKLIKAQHPFLSGSTNLHILLFPTSNGLLIREVLLNKELLCKHVTSRIQMLFQSIAQFVLHECKSGKNMFIFHQAKYINNCYFY